MSKLIVKGADFSSKSVGSVDVSEMRYAPTNGATPPQGMKNFIKIKGADFSQSNVRKIGKLNAPIMHYDGKQKVTIECEKGAELWVCDWSPAYNRKPTYPTNYYQVEGSEDGIVELGMDTNNHYQFRRYAKQIVNGIESPITYIDVCQKREIKGECDIDGNVLDTFKSTSYIYPTYLSSAYVKDEGYKPSVMQEQVVKLDDGKYMYSIHQVWEQCKFTTDGSDPRTSRTAQTKLGIGLLGITLQPNDVVKVATLSPLGVFSKVVTYTFPQRITAHGYNPTDGYIVNHTDNVLVGINPQTNSNGNMMWYWADLVSYDSEEGIALRKPTEDCTLFAMILIDNIYSNIAKKSITVTKSPTITIEEGVATITPNYGNFGTTEGIKTYYSIDGTDPSILYTEPITLTEDCVVKAKTEMYIDSGVFTEVAQMEYTAPIEDGYIDISDRLVNASSLPSRIEASTYWVMTSVNGTFPKNCMFHNEWDVAKVVIPSSVDYIVFNHQSNFGYYGIANNAVIDGATPPTDSQGNRIITTKWYLDNKNENVTNFNLRVFWGVCIARKDRTALTPEEARTLGFRQYIKTTSTQSNGDIPMTSTITESPTIESGANDYEQWLAQRELFLQMLEEEQLNNNEDDQTTNQVL